jgi:DNA polymerase elongation subunit (family B)
MELTTLFEDKVYGALGNPGSRFFDARMAQSTTLSGRCIVKHMQSKINEIITGEYDHTGISCIYGDSVTGDTMIKTDNGEITIEQLYNECVEHSISDGKEYGVWCQAKVIGFNAHEMEALPSSVEYVMRHKTKKKLLRRLERLREMYEDIQKLHSGDGTPYYDVRHFNYYGGQAFGYIQGKITMLEDILSEFDIDF